MTTTFLVTMPATLRRRTHAYGTPGAIVSVNAPTWAPCSAARAADLRQMVKGTGLPFAQGTGMPIAQPASASNVRIVPTTDLAPAAVADGGNGNRTRRRVPV